MKSVPIFIAIPDARRRDNEVFSYGIKNSYSERDRRFKKEIPLRGASDS